MSQAKSIRQPRGMSAMGRLQTFGWNVGKGWKADLPERNRSTSDWFNNENQRDGMAFLANASGSFRRITGEQLDAQRLLDSLNAEQRCVLDRIAKGYSLRSIAVELAVPESHIERLRSDLLRKFDARTTADLIRIRIYAGVSDADSVPDNTKS
jgi:DNA-binding CsgD family transcriptional regulator